MSNVMRRMMRKAVVLSGDSMGKLKPESVTGIIKDLTDDCDFKSGVVQFIITEPKPHPTEDGLIVCILDLGGAIVLDENACREEVYKALGEAVKGMRQKLLEVEIAITEKWENPY